MLYLIRVKKRKQLFALWEKGLSTDEGGGRYIFSRFRLRYWVLGITHTNAAARKIRSCQVVPCERKMCGQKMADLHKQLQTCLCSPQFTEVHQRGGGLSYLKYYGVIFVCRTSIAPFS